ncbi:hypothetical protein E8E12_007964 [Didymella heteroderae]|uniref:Uncharacterized protein n=1 Tax=Didymella heteroderae TaxID=1769908 RepID=A0A9P4WT63_9PLEO|nr:hypothetical protein E8E12_007964 [Didymella heteroderae]
MELLFEDEEIAERRTMKERLKKLLVALQGQKIKEKYKRCKSTAAKAIGKRFKNIHWRIRRMGRKKRTFEARHRQAPRAIDIVTGTHEKRDTVKSAVRRLLTTMFTNIVENDLSLEKHTTSTTQCFLVHPLADLDPNGSFLNRYTQPPPSAFNLDLNLALTFVSRWLQSSLTSIKTFYPEGDCGLQMPFCVLETTQAGANIRARAMQRSNPNEKVGVATLDFAALQRKKLVASAAHTFDFLRVPRKDFPCVIKLLAWADNDEDGLSATALRSMVLTVVGWEDTGVDTDLESVGEELRAAAQTPLPGDEDEELWAKWANPTGKKDSGTVSRTASGDSKGRKTTALGISLTGEQRYPRFLSL